MSAPEHIPTVVTTCTNSACGMRFPCPIDDTRGLTCPLCEAPTTAGATYDPPFVAASGPGRDEAETIGVLDNIRSAMNVGTMLRAADGANVSHMHLCGLTAWIDNPKVIKTALGAEQSVSCSRSLDGTKCVAELASAGVEIWAIESTPQSTLLDEVVAGPIPTRLALIVGNEVAGVDPQLLEMADRHVHLAMAGTKTSLNVGVAFGIASYAVRAARSHQLANSA